MLILSPRTTPYASSRILTILDRRKSTGLIIEQAESLALMALGWILGEDDRAGRFLSLTGLTPDILRERLDDRSVQMAVLEFLINHEPDLIAAADSLQIQPDDIVAAQESLNQ